MDLKLPLEPTGHTGYPPEASVAGWPSEWRATMKTEQYEHHGALVVVVSEVKGKHREHCLCYSCSSFTPEDRSICCPMANELYAFCVANSMVTPVYECPQFTERDNG